MVDFDALDKRIKKSRYTQKYLAERLGLLPSGLKRKLMGQTEFKLDEVTTLARLLNLSDQDLLRIFFWKVHVDFGIYQKGDAP